MERQPPPRSFVFSDAFIHPYTFLTLWIFLLCYNCPDYSMQLMVWHENYIVRFWESLWFGLERALSWLQQ